MPRQDCRWILRQARLAIDVQALGAVPYLVTLDQASDTVVVSLRGSISAADWATNIVMTPELLGEWLPDALKEVCLEWP